MVVAAVVEQPGGVEERELLGPHRVAAPDLDRIEAEVVGEQVDRPLDQGRCLGPAGAAVGDQRRGVGDDRSRGPGDRGDPVRARRHHRRVPRHDRADHRVGTGVDVDEDPEGPDGAVPIAADLDRLALGAGVAEAGHVVAPVRVPDDRSTDPTGEPPEQDLLRVRTRLRPEAATHVGSDDPHLVDGKAQRGGDDGTHRVRALARGPLHEAAVVIPASGRHARLQWAGRHPLVEDDPAHDHVAGLEGGVALVVAAAGRHHDVGAHLGEQQRGSLGQGPLDAHHRRQRLVVDHHQFGGIGCGLRGLGDDGGQRLAHEAHPAGSQQRSGHRLGITGVDHRHRSDVEVGGGHHVDDAGSGPGRLDVDRAQLGVSHRRGDVDHVERTRQIEVGDVGALPPQEVIVLPTRDSCPEQRHSGRR